MVAERSLGRETRERGVKMKNKTFSRTSKECDMFPDCGCDYCHEHHLSWDELNDNCEQCLEIKFADVSLEERAKNVEDMINDFRKTEKRTS